MFMLNNFLASFPFPVLHPEVGKTERSQSYIFPKAFILGYVLYMIFYFIIGLLASSRKESFLLEEVAPLAPRLEIHFEMLTLR